MALFDPVPPETCWTHAGRLQAVSGETRETPPPDPEFVFIQSTVSTDLH